MEKESDRSVIISSNVDMQSLHGVEILIVACTIDIRTLKIFIYPADKNLVKLKSSVYTILLTKI